MRLSSIVHFFHSRCKEWGCFDPKEWGELETVVLMVLRRYQSAFERYFEREGLEDAYFDDWTYLLPGTPMEEEYDSDQAGHYEMIAEEEGRHVFGVPPSFPVSMHASWRNWRGKRRWNSMRRSRRFSARSGPIGSTPESP